MNFYGWLKETVVTAAVLMNAGWLCLVAVELAEEVVDYSWQETAFETFQVHLVKTQILG